MFCKHCGKEIVDDAVVCIHCGRELGLSKQIKLTNNERWERGFYALLIIGALLVPAIGLVMGLINIDNEEKKDQAKVLVAIGAINMILTLAIIIF